LQQFNWKLISSFIITRIFLKICRNFAQCWRDKLVDRNKQNISRIHLNIIHSTAMYVDLFLWIWHLSEYNPLTQKTMRYNRNTQDKQIFLCVNGLYSLTCSLSLALSLFQCKHFTTHQFFKYYGTTWASFYSRHLFYIQKPGSLVIHWKARYLSHVNWQIYRKVTIHCNHKTS